MRHFLGSFFVLILACGSSDAVDPNATLPGQPPPEPSGAGVAAASTTTLTYAIDALWLGEAPRDGGPASDVAWRSFGFDLDRRVTGHDATDVCTLSAGAPGFNRVDGDFGIDNNWGSILLPLVETALSLPSPSITASDAFSKGASTLEFEVTGLPEDASASAIGLSASAFVAAATSDPPFDAGAERPVVASSVADGATIASGARVAFGDAYVNRGAFVGRAASAPITLTLPFAQPLEITIRDAVVAFDRSSDPTNVSGTLAGVVDTDAFLASALAIGTTIFPSLCTDASEFDGTAALIRQARDILDDGTNRAGVACTGISIGLGFHARLVANPTEVVADPPPFVPCP